MFEYSQYFVAQSRDSNSVYASEQAEAKLDLAAWVRDNSQQSALGLGSRNWGGLAPGGVRS